VVLAAVVCACVVSGFSRTVWAGFCQPLHAQEGHPLAGTWHGTWGPNANDRHDVTLVMDYDGKAVTGMINPGPDAVHFDRVTLDPATWTVRFDAKGIVIDAKIEDVTNRHRSIVGTWTQGAMKGDFKVSRDD
jgi:hypothetical protein